MKILEIGCGPGTLWVENVARIPADCSVTLSDYSPGMVSEARGNLGVNNKIFTCEASNSMAIPFSRGIFDTVIANHMLYHIPDIQAALGEITRVLKPGGRFFAATNGKDHLKELDEIMDDSIHFGRKSYATAFSSGSFTLENGTHLLSAWFKHIEIQRYDDALIVTEAYPLVSYILSMIPRDDIPAESNYIDTLSSSINQQIELNGSIHIQKPIGMFVCE